MVTVALLMSLSGCRTTHVVTADADGRPQFAELTVVYEVVEPTVTRCQATTISLAEAKAHPLRTAVASRTSRSLEANARFELRLVIRAPHPEGDPGTALATLEAPVNSEGRWQTLATRTLPRTEVDLLLTHLVNGGLFDDQTRPYSNTRIAVEIDGHCVEKPWTREPRLDRLAVETYDAAN